MRSISSTMSCRAVKPWSCRCRAAWPEHGVPRASVRLPFKTRLPPRQTYFWPSGTLPPLQAPVATMYTHKPYVAHCPWARPASAWGPQWQKVLQNSSNGMLFFCVPKHFNFKGNVTDAFIFFFSFFTPFETKHGLGQFLFEWGKEGVPQCSGDAQVRPNQ